jgi:hypothetical protein
VTAPCVASVAPRAAPSTAPDRVAAPALLHNMSAPPRSHVELRPLRTGTDRPRRPPVGVGGEPPSVAEGPSARLFARVCLVGLLSDGEASQPRGRDIVRGIDNMPHDLIDAVAALRCGRFRVWHCDGVDSYQRDPVLHAEQRQCQTLPASALHDELIDRLAAIDAGPLPPLLIARQMDLSIDAPPDTGPMLALRLLAGTTGNLFVRARAVGAGAFLCGLPGSAGIACQFDYWLPTGAHK